MAAGFRDRLTTNPTINRTSYRPPMVWLNSDNQAGLLLAWIRNPQSPQ